MKHQLACILASTALLVAGCTSENPGTSGPATELDASSDADTYADVRDTGPTPEDGGGMDARFDSGADADSGADEDAGSDGGTSSRRTLTDYRRCVSDNDCPVGLGSCIKSVRLNRPDADGTEFRAIQEIFPSLGADEGICTFTCSANADQCDQLSVNGSQPDPEPHTCQVVVVGQAPYPETPPTFPFDDQLDPSEQEEGRAFGAICRPPVQLDDAVDDSFCTSCQMPEGCQGGQALCWNAVTQAPAVDGETGTCLTPCADDEGCPLGFACDASDDSGQSYCRPRLDTCTACQDRDDDGFGTGRCGEDFNPVTAHDCDDRNPNAYLDPPNPEHPFPTFCGEFDYNCNGLSDVDEQLGHIKYPVAHCVSCFDDCQGAVAHGEAKCQKPVDAPTACLPDCDDGWADCDGDLSNGCEVEVTDPSRIYYRDADGDGFGDPGDSTFSCQQSSAPAGYVANQDDCNDTAAEAYGGSSPAAEVCDGLDNNCDGAVDEQTALPDVGTSCSTGFDGQCDVGTWVCDGSAGMACEANIAPGAQLEACDSIDNDCDGQIDEQWSQSGVDPSSSLGYAAYYTDADNDGYYDDSTSTSNLQQVFACPSNIPANFADTPGDCDDSAATVNPGQSEVCATPQVDDNCDGILVDQNTDGAAQYYADSDNDGYGAPNSSVWGCGQPSGYVTDNTDCDDNSTQVNPGADELCGDFIDNDCDGDVDDAFDAANANYAYYDGDGDGHGHQFWIVPYCGPTPPSGHVTSNDDCDDTRDTVSPSSPEVCDSYDNNCDGDTNEGCPDHTVSNGILTTGQYTNRGGVSYPAGSGDDERYVLCPGDQVMWGVSVWEHNDNIQTIDIFCAEIELSLDDTDPDNWTYTFGLGAPSSLASGPGDHEGTNSWGLCSSGEAIHSLHIWSGTRIETVEFECRKFSLTPSSDTSTTPYGVTAGVTTDVHRFGTDGMQQPERTCGPNSIAVGLHMTANTNFGSGSSDELYTLELLCKDVELNTITP